MIEVACGILKSAAGLFVARRAPHKSEAGSWEFPGGKREPDENWQETLRREFKEEFSIEVRPVKYLAEIKELRKGNPLHLRAYFCRCEDWEGLRLTAHDQWQWIHPQELRSLKLLPADRILFEKINFDVLPPDHNAWQSTP